MEKLTYEKPRELNVFKRFLETRKQEIANDLELLSKNFGVDFEKLVEVKKDIRNILHGAEFISTTIHLRPRAIDYLMLADERISNVSDKVFHYPIYYQSFDKEKPDLIDIGNFKVSLTNIIPGFKEKNKKKEFKSSLDFHETLLNYLKNNNNWQEEVSNNLDAYLNKEFANFDRRLRGIAIEYIKETFISILKDYGNFFEKMPYVNKEGMKKINSDLASLFINNFSALSDILEKLDISKEYLEDIKERRIDVDYKFIVAVCTLGNMVHIGAEYGKFNEKRKLLKLKELEDPEKPQERFRFFAIEGDQKVENGTMRFLFGSKNTVTQAFILTAMQKGWEEGVFSFVDENLRKRIRVLDFYSKFKELKISLKNLLESVDLNSDEFVNLMKNLNYFEHLDEKEKEFLEKILNNFVTIKESGSVEKWLSKFNELLGNWETLIKESGYKKERLEIKSSLVLNKIFSFLFENYINGSFENIQKLPPAIAEKFFAVRDIEKLPADSKTLENKSFYGLEFPIVVKNIDKEDLIHLSILFKWAEGGLKHGIPLKI